jgi:hypothetical protein
MDLVDEEDRALLVLQGGEHRLEAVLEVAAVARAGKERSEIETEDLGLAERLRHLPLGDAQRQPLDQGGLADAGIAHVDRVVLAPPLQDVERALELGLAADQRVDGAFPGHLGQVLGEGGEGVVAPRGVLGLVLVVSQRQRDAVDGLQLRDAVGQVAHHVQPGHSLGFQHVGREGLGLFVDRHEKVRAADLVAAGGLHAEDGAGEGPLDPQGEAGMEFLVRAEALERRVEVLGEALLDPLEIAAGMAEDPGGLLVESQGIEEVLQPGVFMPETAGFGPGHLERDLQIARQFHSSGLAFFVVFVFRRPGLQPEGHFMLPRLGRGLGDLGFGHVLRVDARHAESLVVHLEHDVDRFGRRLPEVLHQDVHDEIHRREVVVVDQHLPTPGTAGFLPLLDGEARLPVDVRAPACAHAAKSSSWSSGPGAHGCYSEGS